MAGEDKRVETRAGPRSPWLHHCNLAGENYTKAEAHDYARRLRRMMQEEEGLKKPAVRVDGRQVLARGKTAESTGSTVAGHRP